MHWALKVTAQNGRMLSISGTLFPARGYRPEIRDDDRTTPSGVDLLVSISREFRVDGRLCLEQRLSNWEMYGCHSNNMAFFLMNSVSHVSIQIIFVPQNNPDINCIILGTWLTNNMHWWCHHICASAAIYVYIPNDFLMRVQWCAWRAHYECMVIIRVPWAKAGLAKELESFCRNVSRNYLSSCEYNNAKMKIL